MELSGSTSFGNRWSSKASPLEILVGDDAWRHLPPDRCTSPQVSSFKACKRPSGLTEMKAVVLDAFSIWETHFRPWMKSGQMDRTFLPFVDAVCRAERAASGSKQTDGLLFLGFDGGLKRNYGTIQRWANQQGWAKQDHLLVHEEASCYRNNTEHRVEQMIGGARTARSSTCASSSRLPRPGAHPV